MDSAAKNLFSWNTRICITDLKNDYQENEEVDEDDYDDEYYDLGNLLHFFIKNSL